MPQMVAVRVDVVVVVAMALTEALEILRHWTWWRPMGGERGPWLKHH